MEFVPDTAFWNDRKVLITGGRGFLGQAVVDQVRNRGARELFTPSSAEYDLRDRTAVRQLFADTRPDLVIHLAARVGGIGANMERPAELYLDNLLMGTYVLDEAHLQNTPKTVMVGTICSYPKFTPVPFSEDSLWQGYPEETNAPYGIAKLAQLVQVQANRSQYGQDAIYLMPTNLYGPRDKFHPAVSHVIPALIKRYEEARLSGETVVTNWGSGTPLREFLYVDDLATATLHLLEKYDGPQQVNVGTGSDLSIKEIADLVGKTIGYEGKSEWDKSKPDGTPKKLLDISKIKSFGWEPKISLEEGLKLALADFRTKN
jgi:nucleoside-diphosphate-sugar epimerase